VEDSGKDKGSPKAGKLWSPVINEEVPGAINKDRPRATSTSPSPQAEDLGATANAQTKEDTM
jgi:hypothetical protein